MVGKLVAWLFMWRNALLMIGNNELVMIQHMRNRILLWVLVWNLMCNACINSWLFMYVGPCQCTIPWGL